MDKPVALRTHNTFKAKDISPDAIVRFMVEGSAESFGLIEFQLLPGSPLRQLLELQEVYQEAWEEGRKAREAEQKNANLG